MKRSNIYFVSIFISICVCVCFCKTASIVSTKDTTLTANDSLKEWLKTAEAGKQEAMNNWVELVDGDWDFFKRSYQTDLKETDILGLKLVPNLAFKIDRTDFENLDSHTEMNKILKLDKKRIIYNVIKENQFVAAIRTKVEGGKWVNEGGYGGMFKSVAAHLEELYFKKNIPFYDVYVNPYTNSVYEYGFLVFEENGQFKSIRYDKIYERFADELIELRNYLKENNK